MALVGWAAWLLRCSHAAEWAGCCCMVSMAAAAAVVPAPATAAAVQQQHASVDLVTWQLAALAATAVADRHGRVVRCCSTCAVQQQQ